MLLHCCALCRGFSACGPHVSALLRTRSLRIPQTLATQEGRCEYKVCVVQFIQDKLNSVLCSAHIVKKMENYTCKDMWFVKPKFIK
jgi:hypothetical protein